MTGQFRKLTEQMPDHVFALDTMGRVWESYRIHGHTGFQQLAFQEGSRLENSRFVDVAGQYALFAITHEGDLVCWMDPSQLGYSSVWPSVGLPLEVDTPDEVDFGINEQYPHRVITPYRFTSVTAADKFGAGITDEGKLIVWGDLRPVLGEGATVITPTPLEEVVSALGVPQRARGFTPGETWQQVVARDNMLAAITSDGRLLVGGDWGLENTRWSFRPVASEQPIEQVAVSGRHLLAVDVHGECWSMGQNSRGELGAAQGSLFAHSLQKVQVPAGLAISEVSCAGDMSAALDSYGRTWQWGGGEVLTEWEEPDLLRSTPRLHREAALSTLCVSAMNGVMGITPEGALHTSFDSDQGEAFYPADTASIDPNYARSTQPTISAWLSHEGAYADSDVEVRLPMSGQALAQAVEQVGGGPLEVRWSTQTMVSKAAYSHVEIAHVEVMENCRDIEVLNGLAAALGDLSPRQQRAWHAFMTHVAEKPLDSIDGLVAALRIEDIQPYLAESWDTKGLTREVLGEGYYEQWRAEAITQLREEGESEGSVDALEEQACERFIDACFDSGQLLRVAEPYADWNEFVFDANALEAIPEYSRDEALLAASNVFGHELRLSQPRPVVKAFDDVVDTTYSDNVTHLDFNAHDDGLDL